MSEFVHVHVCLHVCKYVYVHVCMWVSIMCLCAHMHMYECMCALYLDFCVKVGLDN